MFEGMCGGGRGGRGNEAYGEIGTPNPSHWTVI